MIAVLQHIVYDQFVPSVIGDEGSAAYRIVPTTTGFFTGHNSSVNAQLYNEFTTAAMRYGRKF